MGCDDGFESEHAHAADGSLCSRHGEFLRTMIAWWIVPWHDARVNLSTDVRQCPNENQWAHPCCAATQVEQKEGLIINMGSVAAVEPMTKCAVALRSRCTPMFGADLCCANGYQDLYFDCCQTVRVWCRQGLRIRCQQAWSEGLESVMLPELAGTQHKGRAHKSWHGGNPDDRRDGQRQ